MNDKITRFIERYKQDPTKIYNEKYYRRHLEQYRDWEKDLGSFICEKYNIQSVVDFGCGVGSYLEGFQRSGCETLKGIEYSFDSSKKFTPPNILPFIEKGDATKFIDGIRFECVWSVEIAEHIPPEGTDQFIDNLSKFSSKYIFLTAAPPGQRGTGHINCRSKSFWIEEIEKRGFRYLQENVTKIVEFCKQHGKIPKYIMKNVMFFERKSS